MEIFPCTLLMTTICPVRLPTIDGRMARREEKKNYNEVSSFSVFLLFYPLTLGESNGTEVIGLHDISLNRDVGVQNVATVTNACIIDEDVYMTMALQNVLSGPGNQSCVGEVKGDSAWSKSLKKRS